MPRAYEAIRDHLISQGLSVRKAQSKAAAIYNAKHPAKPVTSTLKDKKKKEDNIRYA